MKRICKVKDCKEESRKLGYCNKHYCQVHAYGHIFERTVFDKNEIIIDKNVNYAYICLYDRTHKEISRAIIDIDDVDKVKDIKWRLLKTGYVCGKVSLHQFITKSKHIDHINQNKLDNRKANLREATKSQNGMNIKLKNNNTSGYIGVYFDKERKKYHAFINCGHIRKFLGRRKRIEDALELRKKAEILYFGDFRPLCEVEKNDNKESHK